MPAKKWPYPLIFEPILSPRIWGGDRLGHAKDGTPIGEAWLFSPLPNAETPIANGSMAGQRISTLSSQQRVELLGTRKELPYPIPLILKLIDTAQKLSVQVHPDEKIAHGIGEKSGKDEAWYIIKAKKDASVFVGFSQSTSAKEVGQALQNGSLASMLRCIPVAVDDFVNVDAGQIHTIGDGIGLLEIQQPLDITYRLHDFGRLGSDGKPRELQIDEALRSLHYTSAAEGDLVRPNHAHRQVLREGPYFRVTRVELDRKQEGDEQKLESSATYELITEESAQFLILLDGFAVLQYADYESLELTTHKPVLIPICSGQARILAREKASLLTIRWV